MLLNTPLANSILKMELTDEVVVDQIVHHNIGFTFDVINY